MKYFKRNMLFVAVAVIAGTVVFTACKKDEEDSPAVKAGKEFCECSGKTNEAEKTVCYLSVFATIGDIVTFTEGIKDEKAMEELITWVSTNCSTVMKDIGYLMEPEEEEEEEDSPGVKLGKALCDCYNEPTEDEQDACAEAVYVDNKDLFTDDLEFKDEKVAAEALAWILANCSEALEWEDEEE
ncbi:MAG: hypothetical protein LBR08_13580 [Bacteroidales bacterium]|jgi:hypothetical protein|nr:hypothetical protein [Bacteroidales bacterium]